MLKKIGFLLCIIVIVINLLNYNFDLDFSDNDNKISLIGVLSFIMCFSAHCNFNDF